MAEVGCQLGEQPHKFCEDERNGVDVVLDQMTKKVQTPSPKL